MPSFRPRQITSISCRAWPTRCQVRSRSCFKQSRTTLRPMHATRSDNHQHVVSTIHEFCRAFDQRDWTALRRCLPANLVVDYSSFRGTPPTRMTALRPPDHLLVFYIPGKHERESGCAQMISAGFREVPSYNPYWDLQGRTFEDIDGYRVVLQNAAWTK
jgi:hypothetical protein